MPEHGQRIEAIMHAIWLVQRHLKGLLKEGPEGIRRGYKTPGGKQWGIQEEQEQLARARKSRDEQAAGRSQRGAVGSKQPGSMRNHKTAQSL